MTRLLSFLMLGSFLILNIFIVNVLGDSPWAIVNVLCVIALVFTIVVLLIDGIMDYFDD